MFLNITLFLSNEGYLFIYLGLFFINSCKYLPTTTYMNKKYAYKKRKSVPLKKCFWTVPLIPEITPIYTSPLFNVAFTLLNVRGPHLVDH